MAQRRDLSLREWQKPKSRHLQRGFLLAYSAGISATSRRLAASSYTRASRRTSGRCAGLARVLPGGQGRPSSFLAPLGRPRALTCRPPAWTFCCSPTRLLEVGELPLVSRQCDCRASNQPSLSMMSMEIRLSPWKSGLACGSRGLNMLRTSAPSTTSPKMV